MATTSIPPPPKTGGRSFIVAAIIMLLLMGGLIFYQLRDDEPPGEPVPQAAVPALGPTLDQVVPPPPPLPTTDAGTPTRESTRRITSSGNTFCSTCGSCSGTEAPSFRAMVRSRASQAQRCYEKALAQQDQLQGKLTVSLCVGVGGSVCNANITSDQLGSPLVSQCVLNIFRAATFPSPKNGCVDAQVPLNFVPQKQ